MSETSDLPRGAAGGEPSAARVFDPVAFEVRLEAARARRARVLAERRRREPETWGPIAAPLRQSEPVEEAHAAPAKAARAASARRRGRSMPLFLAGLAFGGAIAGVAVGIGWRAAEMPQAAVADAAMAAGPRQGAREPSGPGSPPAIWTAALDASPPPMPAVDYHAPAVAATPGYTTVPKRLAVAPTPEAPPERFDAIAARPASATVDRPLPRPATLAPPRQLASASNPGQPLVTWLGPRPRPANLPRVRAPSSTRVTRDPGPTGPGLPGLIGAIVRGLTGVPPNQVRQPSRRSREAAPGRIRRGTAAPSPGPSPVTNRSRTDRVTRATMPSRPSAHGSPDSPSGGPSAAESPAPSGPTSSPGRPSSSPSTRAGTWGWGGGPGRSGSAPGRSGGWNDDNGRGRGSSSSRGSSASRGGNDGNRGGGGRGRGNR